MDGYDAEPWNGVSDYTLYRENEEVLAVVEAKKTFVDVRLAEAQLTHYVTEIEKHQSFRPFGFLANGLEIHLQSAGAAVGVISAILAFVSYIISSAPAVRQAISWVDDINVLSYSDESVGIGNNGDGEVFVSYIFIETETGMTTIRTINKAIKVSEILTAKLSPINGSYTVVSGLTDSEWENYLLLDGEDNADGHCIAMYFYSESDPALRLYSNALGDDLRKVNATATIYYFSNKLGVELNKQFPVYGILYEFEKSCSELHE